jgi:centractin
MVNALEQDTFIGKDVDKYKGVIKLSHPIEHGVIKNWDEMENIWRYIFEELGVNPKDHPVLLTEPPLNPTLNRVQTAKIFFETFGVPALYFQTQSVLSLYARGMTSGVVLDCGDGQCHSCAVYEGYSITNACNRIDIGGREITQHLMMLLRRAGYAFHTTSEFELVRKIKEKHCILNVRLPPQGNSGFVGEDNAEKQSYTLPDGSHIELKEEVH